MWILIFACAAAGFLFFIQHRYVRMICLTICLFITLGHSLSRVLGDFSFSLYAIPTEATLTKVKTDYKVNRGSYSFRCDVQYSFKVEGQTFIGEDRIDGSPCNEKALATGNQFTIHYLPKSPQRNHAAGYEYEVKIYLIEFFFIVTFVGLLYLDLIGKVRLPTFRWNI